jgi:RND family efflux transporter MFP subunit
MLWSRFTSPVVASAALMGLVACSHETPPDPRVEAPLVRAAVVQHAPAATRSFTGTVAARVQSDLGFRVPGKVLERLVDAGQKVERGQVLMRLDPVDLKLATQAQRAAVAAARARMQQATEEEARYRDLRGTGAISVSAYDQIKAAADTAVAQLNAAEAQAQVALNADRYAVLVADAEGVVTETLAEPGQVVNAGQVVVRLARAGSREAAVQLPETLRPALGSLGQATLYGTTGVAGPAKLRQIADAADRLTRTFEARYVLEGAVASAPLGSTVTIEIPVGPTATAPGLQVPLGALFDAGQGPGVWVLEGEPTKVAWRPVTVRHLEDEGARVEGRLAQGDRIVALGAHLLREGEAVRVLGALGAAAAQGARP